MAVDTKQIIPIVKFDIDENEPLNGVKVISLVQSPAISSDFIYLNSIGTANYVELAGTKYKQVLAGLALIPDINILRFNSLGEPYYGVFSKEVIEKIRNKFHKELLT